MGAGISVVGMRILLEAIRGRIAERISVVGMRILLEAIRGRIAERTLAKLQLGEKE